MCYCIQNFERFILKCWTEKCFESLLKYIYIYIYLYNVQDDGNCLYCYDRNDSIMLPSVFNDLFEGEEEGSPTTSSFEIFSILTF